MILAREWCEARAIDGEERKPSCKAILTILFARRASPSALISKSLIRVDYERCHPGEALEDMKLRSAFSKEDKGLLRDWMAVAAVRAAAEHQMEMAA